MSILSTQSVFDRTAATYDPARARLIPCFDRFYSTAIDLLPEAIDRVLDLGAGTGLLSAFVRQRFAEASLHLIDNSEPMLAGARERFRHDPRVSFELADYTRTIGSRTFGAIVSALSIHHLEEAAKQRLFPRILDALRPGGLFINAEQILAPTPELEADAKAQWLRDVRALGATEEQIAASLLRQTEDRCATVADQLHWLQNAGFTEVGCAFAEGRFAVLHASRP